jgi:glycosyltransferase involved in cell wall biosynthesis
LIGCDSGISPTNWQKTRYPTELQHKIEVIHEGIDTTVVCPNPNASVTINGKRFQLGDELITYVARNLEPYRGIHTFMRSIPAIQSKRPNARIIIVGGNDVSYGKKLPQGETYRQRYCAEINDMVDWSKVFFVGNLPYADYLKVLQVSAAHVYLTYPFVLSWSMLEAMSAGCLLIASNTAPVKEVIEHGENGLLFDFFDHEELSMLVAQALENMTGYQNLRNSARNKIISDFDLSTVCMPKLLKKIAE